jgi:integrase/recombinase XerD
MQKIIQEDSNLRSFFDYLFIEKGLSQNTVKAYENDILSFLNWVKNTPNLN